MRSHRTKIDRQLRAVDADNRAVMPRWRELLERVFSGEERLSVPQKAELLGVPGRRQLFHVGGLAIAGSALLAACGDDDGGGDAVEAPGTTADTRGVEAGAGSPEMDVILTNTAISLEVLAIDTYQAVIDSALIESAVVADAAALFQAHHAEHRDALVAVVEAAGAAPFTTANPVVRTALVDPALREASVEGDLVRLAHDLEQTAAQTYVFAATSLSTPQLRSTVMTIGGVEARHAAILDMANSLGREKPAFFPSTNPLPEDAVVTG